MIRLVIEIELDRIPVQSVAQREQFERDLNWHVQRIINLHDHTVERKLTIRQEDL